MARPREDRVTLAIPRRLADRLDAVGEPAGLSRSQVARAFLSAALPPLDLPTTDLEAPECPQP